MVICIVFQFPQEKLFFVGVYFEKFSMFIEINYQNETRSYNYIFSLYLVTSFLALSTLTSFQ